MIKQTLLAAAALLLTASACAAGVADLHAKLGLDCTSCHGPDGKGAVSMETCTGCHQIEALVSQTKNVKPTNPHVSPHYASELDCMSCHMGHAESENFCNQCHQFAYKVP